MGIHCLIDLYAYTSMTLLHKYVQIALPWTLNMPLLTTGSGSDGLGKRSSIMVDRMAAIEKKEGARRHPL